MLLTRRSLTLGTLAGAAVATLAPEGLRHRGRRGVRPVVRESAGRARLGAHRVPHGLHRHRHADPGRRTGPRLRVSRPAPGRQQVRPRRRQLGDGRRGDRGPRRARALLPRPRPRSSPPTWRPASPASSPAARSKGARIGARAAADMLASRVGDHYLDPSFHYAKAPGPGVWQPNPGTTDMLAPWLGSLRPLVPHGDRCAWPVRTRSPRPPMPSTTTRYAGSAR